MEHSPLVTPIRLYIFLDFEFSYVGANSLAAHLSSTELTESIPKHDESELG